MTAGSQTDRFKARPAAGTSLPAAPAPPGPGRSLRLSAAALCLALAGCMSARTAPLSLSFAPAYRGVSFSSDPPGARVIVDGRDSGFVTPCALRIGKGSRHRLEFTVRGYRTAVRIVHPHWQIYSLKWDDMDRAGPRTFRFPFWLGFGEVLMPVRYVSSASPSRIHVELELIEPDLDAIERELLDLERAEGLFDPEARRRSEPAEPGPPTPVIDEVPVDNGDDVDDVDIDALLDELGYIDEPPADSDEPDGD